MIVNSLRIAVMLLLPSFVCLNKICNGSRLIRSALPQLDPIFFVQQLFPDDYNICKKEKQKYHFSTKSQFKFSIYSILYKSHKNFVH